MRTLRSLFTGAALIALMGAALPAEATPSCPTGDFCSTLTDPNSAISGFPGPYGTVTVDLTSPTMATVIFTSNISGANAFLFGDGSSAALAVNSASFSASATGTNSLSGFSSTPEPTTQTGLQNVDDHGTFNLTVNSFDGFTHSSTTITIELTDLVGTWSSSSNVLTANLAGNDAAAHIFVCADPASTCTDMSSATATGFAGEMAPSSSSSSGSSSGAPLLPEPGTLFILGAGLAGLALLRRKFERS